ncbi:MAG: hypothetical protein JXA18_17035 [Chitinispirillaceae bacterium]|nr:hypothetical protein [Chitinispirillaceae bacterium]
MSNSVFRGKSPPPAGKKRYRLSDRDPSVRPAASGTDQEIDAALSSTRLFANARNRMLASRKLYNLLFRPYLLKLPIEFAAIVMMIFFSADRCHLRSGKQGEKRDHHSVAAVSPRSAPSNRSANHAGSENNRFTGAEQGQPATAAMHSPKESDGRSSMRPYAGKDASTPQRMTESSPAAERRMPGTVSAKKNRRRTAALSPMQTEGRNTISDTRTEMIDNETSDLDKKTIFYEPVNNGSVRGTDGTNAGSNIRSSRTSSPDRSDRPPRPDAAPVSTNRIRILSGLAGSFGGRLEKVLEHYGDYYKLKIILPAKNVEAFKAALSQKAVVSYAFTTVAATRDTTIISFEMHAKK